MYAGVVALSSTVVDQCFETYRWTDAYSIRAATQMCMTAGLALAALPDLAAAAARTFMSPRAARRAGQALGSGLLLATTALSLSRIAALRLHYGAPMRVYSALPQVGITHPDVQLVI